MKQIKVRFPFFLLFLSLFFIKGKGNFFAASKLLSLSIGKMQDQSFTSREVHINYILEKVLYSTDSKVPKKLKIQDPLFLSQVNSFLLEQAIELEMQNFSEPFLSSKEEEDKWKKVESLSHPYWLEQEVSKNELKTLLRKKILVKKFLQARIEASSIPPTKTEIYDYFLQNKKKIGSTAFKRLEKKISEELHEKQLNTRISEWFQMLHRKYNIKNLMTDVTQIF